MDVKHRSVEFDAAGVRLRGDLMVPEGAVAMVLFAHGSGSSRLSPRNIQVAKRLHEDRIGTLLFDLLTEDESTDRANVFDVPLLGGRLFEATRWTSEANPELPLGLFGASTGAAAALVVAARTGERARIGDQRSSGGELTEAETRVAKLAASGLTNREIADELRLSADAVENTLSRVYAKLGVSRRAVVQDQVEHVDVAAVVSRGGRPDLAGDALELVTAPTLLIVGERDHQVLELNRQAQARMRCETRLEIVPGATHLFEEPGALELAADLAAGWFADHFAAGSGRG